MPICLKPVYMNRHAPFIDLNCFLKCQNSLCLILFFQILFTRSNCCARRFSGVFQVPRSMTSTVKTTMTAIRIPCCSLPDSFFFTDSSIRLERPSYVVPSAGCTALLAEFFPPSIFSLFYSADPAPSMTLENISYNLKILSNSE